MKIFLDMDDVVADFKGYAQSVLGHANTNERDSWEANDWTRLKDNFRLYRTLPVKSGARELVKWCKEYSVQNSVQLCFLTAVPRNNDVPWAFWDKVNWAQENFPGIPVMFGPFAKDKKSHCQTGDILIDDKLSNCQEWVQAGGRSHVYRNWEECRAWLEQQLGD
jgi:5'(3')-deoxyribonucleotidase